MALRPAGIISDQSATAATAFPRIELDPAAGRSCVVTEFGISHDGPANNTDAPATYRIYRNTLVGTGAAGTEVKMLTNHADALETTALVECTAIGAGTVTNLHRLFVPIVSGVIWVAAPGREFDCIPAEFVGIQNETAIPSGRLAATYMVWEE